MTGPRGCQGENRLNRPNGGAGVHRSSCPESCEEQQCSLPLSIHSGVIRGLCRSLLLWEPQGHVGSWSQEAAAHCPFSLVSFVSMLYFSAFLFSLLLLCSHPGVTRSGGGKGLFGWSLSVTGIFQGCPFALYILRVFVWLQVLQSEEVGPVHSLGSGASPHSL